MIISKDGEEFTVNTTNEEIEVILYFPKLSAKTGSDTEELEKIKSDLINSNQINDLSTICQVIRSESEDELKTALKGSMTDKGKELIDQAINVQLQKLKHTDISNYINNKNQKDLDSFLSNHHKSQSGETHPKILDECMVFNNNPMDSTWFKTLTNEALEKTGFREDRLSQADQERQREANKGLAEQEIIKNWESPFKDMKPFNVGKKETANKADYSEINLGILDLMADRFSANKGKYEYGNSKKPLDKQEILWALFRHVKKMVQPIQDDEESFKEHLAATLTNCSIILDQLELEK